MTYAELLGLKENVSDVDIIRLLSKEKEFKVDDTMVSQPMISEKGISGDFGEPTPM
jgi:hypothetical protein